MRWTFRVRSLLIAVAAIGMIVAVVANLLTSRRREFYKQRSESFAYGEVDALDDIADLLTSARAAEARGADGRPQLAALLAEAERRARLASWHVKMERHYATAADHPWDPLPPDLPIPGAISGQHANLEPASP